MHCEIRKQITVNVEDRPGMLAYVSKILADSKINIRDISTSDFRKQGIIRVIPDEYLRCEQVLREAGLIPIVVDVIAVELKDNPGSLAAITAALALCSINIEYIYGTANTFDQMNIKSYFNWFTDRIKMILKVSDAARAQEVLRNVK